MRKPMTKEQREASAKRLEKARAAKRKPANLSVHESVRSLDSKHPVSMDKVKSWIKHNEEVLSSLKMSCRRDKAMQKKLNNEMNIIDMYIHNMKFYLRTGLWLDSVYGQDREHSVIRKCTVMAYDKQGNVKRSVGVHYPDIGIYTKEMQQQELEAR